jgi:N-methylhydantoinase A
MCYGRYPEQLRVTTTDANLLLGRLDAHHFLGGHMTLDEEAARAGLTHLARQLGAASAEEAAWGVVQVANAGMERAVRKISVERGYDPRLFTLVPFGGAGPLHACELAQNLQIPRVLVPPVPGVLSAMGMLVAAPTKDYSLTVMQLAAECTLADLRAVFMPMVARAQAEMAQEGHTAVTCHYSLDMRYHGQSHELTIGIELAEGEDVLAKFHAAHENRYGYQQPEAAVELVNARVTAVAPVLPPELPATPIGRTDAAPAKIGEKLVWFRASQPVRTQLYDREKLRPGMQFVGPAVVFQYDTTVVVPPAWETAVDPTGNLLLHHKTTQ